MRVRYCRMKTKFVPFVLPLLTNVPRYRTVRPYIILQILIFEVFYNFLYGWKIIKVRFYYIMLPSILIKNIMMST